MHHSMIMFHVTHFLPHIFVSHPFNFPRACNGPASIYYYLWWTKMKSSVFKSGCGPVTLEILQHISYSYFIKFITIWPKAINWIIFRQTIVKIDLYHIYVTDQAWPSKFERLTSRSCFALLFYTYVSVHLPVECLGCESSLEYIMNKISLA